MGFCSVAETVEIGSDRVTVFRQEDENSTKTATILLRGATQNVLDDLERAIEDGINVVKVVAKDGRLVAGGGAVELELARRLLSQAEVTLLNDANNLCVCVCVCVWGLENIGTFSTCDQGFF